MPKVKRRAPKNGYNNKKKSKYRHNVWKHLSQKAIPILNNNENAKVLMLPSKEGLEIDVAMKFGIKREQIIAIDENPALLAHAKWKSNIPKENRFGCKVSKIGAKIENNNWFLAGANLDFCNTFSEELINEVNSFFANTPIHKEFSFCITMGKGRESKALFMLLKRFSIKKCFKHNRLATLYEMMSGCDKMHMSLDFEKSYYESFPMIYAGFSFNYPNLDKIETQIKRLQVLNKRRWKIYNITVPRDIYGKRYLHDLERHYKNPGSHKLQRTRRYIKNDINHMDKRNQKNDLMGCVKEEMRKIQIIIDNHISNYVESNNIIEKGRFINHYSNKVGRDLMRSLRF